MPGERHHSDEAIEKARAMYGAGETAAAIKRQTGLSEGAIYYWLAGGPANGPRRREPIPLRNDPPLRSTRRKPLGERDMVIRRLWRTAEQQVVEIETRLVEGGGDPNALERDARTLAVLARTVRDLVALDTESTRGARPGMAHEKTPNDDDGSRDLDAFRRELAEKLARIGALEKGA